MKTLLVVFAVSVSINFGFSQNVNTELMAFNTDELSVTKAKPSPTILNSDYLDKVLDNSMAIHVSTLEKQVSQFDITSVSQYKGDPKPFQTIFKTNKGAVKVSYDTTGKIISTIEKYKNVKLPNAVRDKVFKTYSEWTLLNVDYQVYYNTNKKVKKIYLVKIGKGKQKKKIKVNSDGDIL
ncbi:hypothetical protein [Algibacter sp. 2305UL17-15]|uniref:hypothetical protein n=1 Tax=Algibacter sp. 2305UL17-15 TaxID=3231268 RepID=UPI003457E3C9